MSSLYKLYDEEGSIRDREYLSDEPPTKDSIISENLRVVKFIWGPRESGNNKVPSGVILVESSNK